MVQDVFNMDNLYLTQENHKMKFLKERKTGMRTGQYITIHVVILQEACVGWLKGVGFLSREPC